MSSPTRQTSTIRSGEAASRGTASRLANTAIPIITWPIVKRDDLIEELRMRGPDQSIVIGGERQRQGISCWNLPAGSSRHRPLILGTIGNIPSSGKTYVGSQVSGSWWSTSPIQQSFPRAL